MANTLNGVPAQGGIQQKASIVDLVTLEYLTLQFNPAQISVNMESDFVAVASMARNNPVYYFTGSEDTLQFDISFVSVQEDRTDVISKCKWLEALTKNDGYQAQPHRVKFIYGMLFSKSIWAVVAAPYTLQQFHLQFDAMPTIARVNLTLKRITEKNLTREQILDIYS